MANDLIERVVSKIADRVIKIAIDRALNYFVDSSFGDSPEELIQNNNNNDNGD